MGRAGAHTLRTAERRVFAAAACALGLAACGGAEATLTVHSSLPREVTEAAERAFEAAHPGVDVGVVPEPASRTLERLLAGEGSVDVWWGAPGSVLERAAGAGLLAPHQPSWSADLAVLAPAAAPGAERPGGPEHGSLAGRPWHPSLVSPFVIAFNRDSLSLGLAPRDWVDLFHFRFRGEVALLDPAESEEAAHYLGAMIVERLREGRSLTSAFDWLLRLDASVNAYAPDVPDLLERLRFGRALVTILPRHVAEEARHGRAPWLHYRFAESGAPVLVRGIAVAASSDRQELAGAFLDLTGAPDVVRALRVHTRWAPARAGAFRAGAAPDAAGGLPPDFELPLPWTPRPLATDTIAAGLEGWLERWEAEVRGRGASFY